MSEKVVLYAGLVPRGLAYLLDCIVAFAFFATTQVSLFAFIRGRLGIDESWFYSGVNTEIYTLLTISLPIWLYFALFEHAAWQATPGKRVMKLQVVCSKEGERVSFSRALIRTLVKLLPWEIAHLANNLPQPLMYTPDPEFRMGFIVVGLLMGVYMAFVGLSKHKQGLHDLAAKTFVVKYV